LHKLQKLSLSGCSNITDSGSIALLGSIGNELRELDLSGSMIYLSRTQTSSFPKLKKLSLRMCSNITDSGTIALLNVIGTELKDLDLSNTKLSLSKTLTAYFPKLDSISLSYCPNITETGLFAFLRQAGGTERLSLSTYGGTSVSKASIKDEFPTLTVY